MRYRKVFMRIVPAGFFIAVFSLLNMNLSARPNSRHKETTETVRPVRIVAFGDSTTEVWSEDIEQMYVQRLGPALAVRGFNVELINSGVSNHTTEDARARFEKDVRSYRPDVVIIWFGINDSWIDADYGATEPRLTRDQYRQNLLYFIHTLKKDGAQIILMTPNPMRWSDEYRKIFDTEKHLLDVNEIRGINRLLDLYAQDVRDISRAERVVLIDVHKCFEDYGRKPGQSVDDLLLSDGIHPNDEGHILITGLLADRISLLLENMKSGDIILNS
ncbi:MAG: hypothetical protein JXB23_04715 [Candidatus Aminicenantes bacterium]|nr:hypothetical protein [Candidatus Aminicenantes bacterium]